MLMNGSSMPLRSSSDFCDCGRRLRSRLSAVPNCLLPELFDDACTRATISFSLAACDDPHVVVDSLEDGDLVSSLYAKIWRRNWPCCLAARPATLLAFDVADVRICERQRCLKHASYVVHSI